MNNRYPSDMDRFTTTVTIGIIALIVLIIVGILSTDASESTIAVAIPLFVLVSFAAFYAISIKAVVVTDSAVIMERKVGAKAYPLDEIAEVRPITDELDLSLRLFGNGGVFGYMGWFRSSALGPYRANANRRDSRILLTFKDGKKLVLSANQSIELAADIERRLNTNNS